MKILIPTDFSKLSLVAIDYAIAFSEKMTAELILIHVIDLSAPPRARMGSKRLIDTIKTSAEENMQELVGKIKDNEEKKIHISHKIVFGTSVYKVLEGFVLKNEIDIIFIGTKGATGMKKIVIGSNATAIIESSSIPVITIPEYARFRDLKHIVYATDLSDINLEIDYIVAIANLFDSWIHIVNVTPSQIKAKIDTKQLQKELKKTSDYSKIKVDTIVNEDIVDGISEYMANVDGDMLAMFTHKLSLIEKLLGKGITRDVAFQTRIPLFTLNKKHL